MRIKLGEQILIGCDHQIQDIQCHLNQPNILSKLVFDNCRILCGLLLELFIISPGIERERDQDTDHDDHSFKRESVDVESAN